MPLPGLESTTGGSSYDTVPSTVVFGGVRFFHIAHGEWMDSVPIAGPGGDEIPASAPGGVDIGSVASEGELPPARRDCSAVAIGYSGDMDAGGA